MLLKIARFEDGEYLGIGRGRNLALSFVHTPYFLQLDDDFMWNKRSTNVSRNRPNQEMLVPDWLTMSHVA